MRESCLAHAKLILAVRMRPAYLSLRMEILLIFLKQGYNQWAEEKLKWWDAEGKRLQTFLTQMDDEWERHREATRRELEDEIAALKHESLVRSNINQASKSLL